MRNLSLKKLIIALSAIISLVVIIQLIVLQVMQNDNQKLEKDRVNSSKAVVLLKDININVIQIQQFLSDVSATGEEDGLKEAENHYKQSIQRLNDLKNLLENHADIQAQIPIIQQNLESFYPLGISMAKTYAHQGRESGNKIMDAFDKKADILSNSIEKLTASLEQFRVNTHLNPLQLRQMNQM